MAFWLLVRRFLGDRRGGVAMMVGMSIFVLAGALGVAVDSARGYSAKSKLQDAVDAAALAGAKAYSQGLTAGDDGTAEDFASTEARMFFDANYSDDYMGGVVADFDARIDEASDSLIVTAEATIPTSFLQVLGIEEVTISSEAQVIAAQTALELALVVDVTGSMNWTDSNGDVKIDSLQSAGLKLLETLYDEKTTLPGVYLSLVPYRAAVNVGSGRTTWLRNFNAGDFSPVGWRGCVLARDDPRDQNDNPPDTSTNRFPPYFWPASEYGYWATYFFGPHDPNQICPVNEIIPLTDNRTTIEDGINALDAQSGGGTQTSQGLVWGWRAISPRWQGYWGGVTPSDMPHEYDEPNLIKAVVFMTDGIADIGWELMAYGFLDEGNLGTTNEASAEAEVNSRLSTICEAIKAEGVEIFSVMFAVTDPSIESTYRDCASQPEHFFNSPTGEELEAAFEAIGRKLASLRIAR
ncbi:MAG: TadE/TadG family type IV pilus assembly protein [Pseudomonadota bacterium]